MLRDQGGAISDFSRVLELSAIWRPSHQSNILVWPLINVAYSSADHNSPESAPYCGYFAFVVGVDYTFWNFGCSTSAYKLFVDLLPSTTEGGSSPVVLAGGGTSQITPIATTVYVTQQPSSAGGTATVLVAPGATQNGAQISSTTLPTTTKTSTPIGAIVGGILGGIALIAFLSFLLWFYVRKRRKDKAFALAAAQNQQQQADAAAAAAFHNQSRITEIGGTPKPAGAYIQPPSPRTGVFPEKPPDGNQSAHVVNANLGSQSPPPRYPQSPQSNPLIPNPSNYSELEEQRRAGGRTPTSPFSWQTGQRSEQEVSELGGTNRGSWNVLEGVQEMSASTGDINRRPVGGARAEQGQYVDMSGAPMSEAFHSHELE